MLIVVSPAHPDSIFAVHDDGQEAQIKIAYPDTYGVYFSATGVSSLDAAIPEDIEVIRPLGVAEDVPV